MERKSKQPLPPEKRLARLRRVLEEVGASGKSARILAQLESASLALWVAGRLLVKADGARPLAEYLGLPQSLPDMEAAQRLLRRSREEEVGWALLQQGADALTRLVRGVALSPKGRLVLEALKDPPEPWASLGWGLALTPELLGLFLPEKPEEEAAAEDLFADPWA